jgi:4-amino-4-deoxy-L-arabinose transferase-like glycosyltransferase
MNRRVWLLFLLILGLFYLPFMGEAFHIDDRIYLEIAGNIHREPLFPYDYPAVFEGISAPDAASHSHLPLTAYYLALVQWLSGGDREWVMHLAFLVFPLIAGWAFWDLSRRYVSHRFAAVALLLTCPAFLVLGHTLMPDVPLLAFWVLAVSRFFRIRDGDGSTWDWWILALSLLGAAFMSLESAGLLILLAAALLLDWKQSRGHLLKYGALLMLPLAVWVLWYFRAYLHYDRFVLVNTVLHMNKRDAFDWSLFGIKALSFVVNLGSVFIFPLAIWYGFSGTFRTRIGLLVLLLALVPFFTFVPGWHWVQILLFAVFFSSGVLVVWEFVPALLDRSLEVRVMALWFFGIFAAAMLLYYAGSVRYVLLAAPPVVLLWLRRLETRTPEPYLQRNLVWAGVALTALFALLPAYADYRFAGVYRDAARQLVSRYSAPGQTVWFTGEWGFRYYFERQGAKMLRRVDPRARPGDIIIKPYLASPWVTLYDGDEWTALVEQRPVRDTYPIRVIDYSSHAGFYSSAWGILPFSVSTGEKWEWFNVFEVKRPYTGPLPEEETLW